MVPPRELDVDLSEFVERDIESLHVINPFTSGDPKFERSVFCQSEEWAECKRQVLTRSQGHCEHCLMARNMRGRGRFHFHHAIPFESGERRADPLNVFLLCADCHRFVHSRANTTKLFLYPLGEAPVPQPTS
jgi:5-methylcytosine-specific restriction endonuclease McrA